MENSAVTCSIFKDVVVVRYLDHVQYSRAPALIMAPQTRETIGWLIYECEQYITVAYDRDVEPPTLKGGDPKASGLVLLKSDIVNLQKLNNTSTPLLLPELERSLNAQKPPYQIEYALQSTERKTHRTQPIKTNKLETT